MSDSETESQPRRRFQIRSKTLFLTFPQCETPLKVFCELISEYFAPHLSYGVCSREDHEDGNHHLHAALCLSTKKTINNAHALDVLVSPPQHGDYSGRFKGGAVKAFEYVMKDGDYLPLPFQDPPRFDLLTLALNLLKKKGKAQIVVDLIQEGGTLDDLDDREPVFVMTNLRKLQEYFAFRSLKARRRAFVEGQKKTILVQPAPGYWTSSSQLIASWLNTNIRQPRKHRQRQLWVRSAPGAGKTSLLMMLEKAYGLSIYFWSTDEKWWDGYDDGAYDLIVLDEYKAQKRITELNPILSGDPRPVSRRGRHPLVKRDNLPVLILSNFYPAEAYHKASPSALAPLLERLQVVNVPHGEFLRFECLEPSPLPPPSEWEAAAEASAPEPLAAVPQPETSLFGEPPAHYCPIVSEAAEPEVTIDINSSVEASEEDLLPKGLLDDDALSQELSSSDLSDFLVSDHESDPDTDVIPGTRTPWSNARNPAYDSELEEVCGLANDYMWTREVSVPLKKKKPYYPRSYMPNRK